MTQWTLTTDGTGSNGGLIHGPCQGLDGGKRSADMHRAQAGRVQAIRQWKPGQDVPMAQWERIVQGGTWSGWAPAKPTAPKF